MRETIDAVGDAVQDYIEKVDRDIRDDSPITRNRLVRKIRAALRQKLWDLPFEHHDDQFLSMLEPLIAATHNIGELFVGVSATGFVILLKADHPDRMIDHMRAPTDPSTNIHYRKMTTVHSGGRSPFRAKKPGRVSCLLCYLMRCSGRWMKSVKAVAV